VRVYISGPITGKPNLNKDAFQYTERKLMFCGYKTVNPHTICFGVQPGSPWTDYMRVCIEHLARCEAIYMLPGWMFSRGAVVEWMIAKILGIKILRSDPWFVK